MQIIPAFQRKVKGVLLNVSIRAYQINQLGGSHFLNALHHDEWLVWLMIGASGGVYFVLRLWWCAGDPDGLKRHPVLDGVSPARPQAFRSQRPNSCVFGAALVCRWSGPERRRPAGGR